MGAPDYADYTPFAKAEILYDDRQIDDATVIAEYGVTVIDFEYDEPIENIYK